MKNLITLILLFTTSVSFGQQHPRNVILEYKRNDDKSVDITYKKKVPGSYLVKVVFSGLKNASLSNPRFETVVNSFSGLLVKLKPRDEEQHISFSYTYSTSMGDTHAKPDSLFNYILPFRKGHKIQIFEHSNLGEQYFGKERPLNWKSYYAYTNGVDTAYSMRKGIVVKLTDEFQTDTSKEKIFTRKINSLVVEHSDGTYAHYSGFKKNSIFVKLGQTVYPRTKLGVLTEFNKGKYRLTFYIYSIEETGRGNRRTLENRELVHRYVTPYFITENGKEKLKSRKEYIPTWTEENLLKEFTRRQKKKYKMK